MNEEQNKSTENNENANKENANKELVTLIFIIVAILSIINGYTLINKNMTVSIENQWSGECEMQGRKESPKECLERKEKNIKEATEFLNKNEQKMKLFQLISLVTIIILAFTIKKIGYTITTLVVALTSFLALTL